METKYSLGLALSGGGARGYAHLGALQALEEANIRPDIISGVSAGALVAVLYADGHRPKDLLRLMTEQEILKDIAFSPGSKGVFKLDKMISRLKSLLKASAFEDLKIPVVVGTTNFNTGKACFFEAGEISRPLMASCSVPGLFPPVHIHGEDHFDGGVLHNLPVSPIRDRCEKIIAVNINPVEYQESVSGYREILSRMIYLGLAANASCEIRQADLLIEPESMKAFPLHKVTDVDALFNTGYRAARAALTDAGLIHS